jgi:uncharacterized protein
VLATLCVFTILVQGVGDLPDPRPSRWVVDQAEVLSDDDLAALERTLAAERTRPGAEIAVVTVDAVPGTAKQFATALFNHWRLGRADRDDGVLVLLVMAQRRVEIETGDGLQAALPASWLAELQATDMVPAFKQRAFGRGLRAGVDGMAARLRALPGEADRPVAPGEYRDDGQVVPPGAPTAPIARTAPPAGSSAPPATAPPTGDGDEGRGGLDLALALGGLGALGVGGFFGGRALWRRARRCDKCGQQMLLLDEVADDAHLTPGQIVEERVRSVNYDVLVCPGCQHSRISANRRWFSGKHACPACNYRTASESSFTLIEATYSHGGQIRITETCAHCPHRSTTIRHTAQRTRPSSSSSSSSSRGSSWSSSRSSSSSSSRSSSSSSRSSSGGRSSGGGAGSSW